MFKHKEFTMDESLKNEDHELYLESTYNLCVHELGLQQSKRDQTIAFYIAVLSFAIPGIIGMDIPTEGKAVSMILLYLFGTMLTKVVMRYRVYKEVYWITCRTITQLYNVKKEKINKELIQHIFYRTLEKNASSILVFKDAEKRQVDKYKSYKKIQNSAETILYTTLVFMSSIGLWVGIYLLIQFMPYAMIIASAITIINFYYWKHYYFKDLSKVYDAVVDGTDASFNSVFAKAWFLHSFY